MKKESVKLQVDSLKHGNKSSDIGLKQKHILQVQNIRHIFDLKLIGGKVNGKVYSQ